jgi:predicted DNA-binding transcriptional regulator AlpA
MQDASRLPDWPRALRLPLAAAYVGLSPATFQRAVATAVVAIYLTPGTVVWLREDLDRWLDARAGRAPASPQDNPWTS